MEKVSQPEALHPRRAPSARPRDHGEQRPGEQAHEPHRRERHEQAGGAELVQAGAGTAAPSRRPPPGPGAPRSGRPRRAPTTAAACNRRRAHAPGAVRAHPRGRSLADVHVELRGRPAVGGVAVAARLAQCRSRRPPPGVDHVPVEDRARAADLLARGLPDARDEERGVDRAVVEQHLGVGDRGSAAARRRSRCPRSVASAASISAIRGEPSSSDGLWGSAPGGRARRGWAASESGSTSSSASVPAPVSAVGEPARWGRGRSARRTSGGAGRARPAPCGAPSAPRVREIDGHRRLALADSALVTSSVSSWRVTAAKSSALRRMR